MGGLVRGVKTLPCVWPVHGQVCHRHCHWLHGSPLACRDITELFIPHHRPWHATLPALLHASLHHMPCMHLTLMPAQPAGSCSWQRPQRRGRRPSGSLTPGGPATSAPSNSAPCARCVRLGLGLGLGLPLCRSSSLHLHLHGLRTVHHICMAAVTTTRYLSNLLWHCPGCHRRTRNLGLQETCCGGPRLRMSSEVGWPVGGRTAKPRLVSRHKISDPLIPSSVLPHTPQPSHSRVHLTQARK